uniref:Huntingtin interacting protein K n=1 Tax=Oreochromis aureus TaxID=47969 RepID=A0A668T1W8_OREAU
MAAEGDVDLDLEAEENCTGKPAEKPRKHDSGAADLERVTDYAEEKEISSSDLETAMSVIGDRRSREQKAKQEREKELAKVTIKREDVELISWTPLSLKSSSSFFSRAELVPFRPFTTSEAHRKYSCTRSAVQPAKHIQKHN